MSTLSRWLQPEFYREQINTLKNRMETERMFKALDFKHFNNHHLMIYGALTVTAALYLVGRQIRKKPPSAALIFRSRSPDPEKPVDVTTFATKRMKPTERPPGSKSNPLLCFLVLLTTDNHKAWKPSDFKRPTAPPHPDGSPTDSAPLPYRPFRHGPKYSINLGLRSMDWDEWIELDNHYLRYHADKARRLAERGSECVKVDSSHPRVYDGTIELLEELTDYLTERYPNMFKRTAVGLNNLITGEEFDTRSTHLTINGIKESPMSLSARLIQDDLAIMFEKEDGQYYLLAGAVLLAGFWRLSDKFGMPLSEIHTSGDVPGYKTKLEKGMMNFFRRIKPDSPVLRNNYFIQVDDNLAWSTSIGSEDSQGIGWNTAEKNKAIEHHYFRSERQSLRRLPRSGGVVFTIRTYFEPVTAICDEPFVPGRLASAVRSWGDDVARYKGREMYGDVLLGYLDQRHREQVEEGLEVEREEEVRRFPW